MTAAPINGVLQVMLVDARTLAEKVAWLQEAAEHDAAALGMAKQDVLLFAAEITAVAAKAASLCARLSRGFPPVN